MLLITKVHNGFSKSTSFLDYFFKRLDTYYVCEMPTFIKYYRGVDLEKYKDKIVNAKKFGTNDVIETVDVKTILSLIHI